ncbi:MAG: dephospho-CoA kinase [Helicobacteraceae bacterium]|nr:dephospho-CoA kinase [Helicobacteraceae bacterium]
MKNAIAIAGGIATGKSSAVKLLIERGFDAIDADQIARERFYEQAKTIEAVFGALDRATIAARIFSDKAERKKLEDILHPLIRETIFTKSEELERLGRRYFIDIPLFFENRASYPISDVLLIYAPRATQIQRLIRDRKMSEADANARVGAQIPIDDKQKAATWIIRNDKDFDNLREQIERFVKTIQGGS